MLSYSEDTEFHCFMYNEDTRLKRRKRVVGELIPTLSYDRLTANKNLYKD